jgi:subtilisin family serine protease
MLERVSAMNDFDGMPGGLAPQPRFGTLPPLFTDDTFAFFSNFGPVVDIAAPGVCIGTIYPGGFYAAWTGTSFAAPLVSGAAALYIANHPGASPATVPLR